jgi:anti-sigma regulatory factor (Ser/Thr protein kinase)
MRTWRESEPVTDAGRLARADAWVASLGDVHVLVDLSHRAQAVTAARRFVRHHLSSRGVAESDVATTELLTSELVTNAVKYGEPPVSLLIELRRGLVHVSVSDTNPELPRLREPEPTGDGGRGMWLLDTLASMWGWAPAPVGKTVWFELHMPVGDTPPTGDD